MNIPTQIKFESGNTHTEITVSVCQPWLAIGLSTYNNTCFKVKHSCAENIVCAFLSDRSLIWTRTSSTFIHFRVMCPRTCFKAAAWVLVSPI